MDNDTTHNPRKTGLGSRIKGARVKGAAAAEKGAPRENPYQRPNMAAAWAEGYDSVAGRSAPCVVPDDSEETVSDD